MKEETLQKDNISFIKDHINSGTSFTTIKTRLVEERRVASFDIENLCKLAIKQYVFEHINPSTSDMELIQVISVLYQVRMPNGLVEDITEQAESFLNEVKRKQKHSNETSKNLDDTLFDIARGFVQTNAILISLPFVLSCLLAIFFLITISTGIPIYLVFLIVGVYIALLVKLYPFYRLKNPAHIKYIGLLYLTGVLTFVFAGWAALDDFPALSVFLLILLGMAFIIVDTVRNQEKNSL